jgi:hypothetical protein
MIGGWMTPEDYTIVDEGRVLGLLDYDGQPYPELLAGARAPLARLAASIQAEAPRLTATECERAASWVKQWKFMHQPIPHREASGPDSFYQIVEGIKDSREQIDLQNIAVLHLRKSHAWVSAAGAVAGIPIASFFITGIAWYWSGFGLAIAYWIYSKRSRSPILDAVRVWKEQEQRNLWLAIRAAATVHELQIAGLFAYLPDAENSPGKHFDEKKAANALRAERDRLTDALYRDPDLWIA